MVAINPWWLSIHGGYQAFDPSIKNFKLHSTVRHLTKLRVVNECLRNKEAEASAMRDNVKTNKNK